MDKTDYQLDYAVKSLIKLGASGFQPLLEVSWISQVLTNSPSPLTSNDKLRSREIIEKLSRFKSLERKRNFIANLAEEDRKNFIRIFMKLVEGEVLDGGPQIQ